MYHTVFRGVSDNPDIGLQRDGQTYAYGVAVDCGDHRLAQFEGGRVDRGCGERTVVNRVVERRCAAGEIRSRAKGPARAGDHDGAHVVVVVAVSIGLTQQRAHLGGVGVELLGAIQREDRHTLIDLDNHLSHASKYTTAPQARHVVSNFTSPGFVGQRRRLIEHCPGSEIDDGHGTH